MPKDDGRIAKSFRFSAEAVTLLERLSRDTGLNQTAVLELLIRDEAKRRGLREGAE